MARGQLQSVIPNAVRFETLTLEKSLPCSTYSCIFGFYYQVAMDGLYASRCFSEVQMGLDYQKEGKSILSFNLRETRKQVPASHRCQSLSICAARQYDSYSVALLRLEKVSHLSCRPLRVNLLNTTKTPVERQRGFSGVPKVNIFVSPIKRS